ncbi:unnamed protein product [Nesidiocoris tenuis]|uniref:Ionotropic glutamate receptor L-glutamate and glycine-binding domain-containing protein n=1 Tax=Nesidiocoris tenuis TaxID=355587 RepID=A0A6H5HIX5_9HEMI|nr:unnamed protein product [Nesidiocoris tenuis]
MESFCLQIEMEGMTGKIRFDEMGNRKDFSMHISELTKSGLKKIGTWDTEQGVSYSRTKEEMEGAVYQSISNKTFIVVSRLLLSRRWALAAQVFIVGLSTDRYEGYSMDLIDEIAKELNFKYKFVLAPDGQYGSYNKETKQWNGLIRELRERPHPNNGRGERARDKTERKPFLMKKREERKIRTKEKTVRLAKFHAYFQSTGVDVLKHVDHPKKKKKEMRRKGDPPECYSMLTESIQRSRTSVKFIIQVKVLIGSENVRLEKRNTPTMDMEYKVWKSSAN